MTFLDRLLGRASRDGSLLRDGMYVVRDPAIAAHIAEPATANFARDTPGACTSCGKPMREFFITTGGPHGDPAVWREHPIAVDGWACTHCSGFAYPRRFEPEQMTALGTEASDAQRAGRFDEAEWRFTRITWNWPGWSAGYVDLASALMEAIRELPDLDTLEKHRRRSRARHALARAIETCVNDPEHNGAEIASVAYMRAAELAIDDRDIARARREIAACRALPKMHSQVAPRLQVLERYVDERLDLFDSAARMIRPYLDLTDRRAMPIETPEERAQVRRAIEQLEEHAAIAPHRWQAAWMLAKAHAAIGDRERSMTVWQDAWARFDSIADIAREYSLALLRADRVDEALSVNRSITERVTTDATLWCNRAVVELLAGDLDEAVRCLDRSDALDANDRVALVVRERVDDVMAGRRERPRTLREMERR